jgi:hypothetical protein
MGWRGTLRTLGAIAREAERNAQRRQREHQKYLNAVSKAEQAEYAAQAVRAHQDHLKRLVSIHKISSSPTLDWSEDATAPAPTKPVESHSRTAQARQRLESYRPSWIARLLRFDRVRERAFNAALVAASASDATDNRKNQEEFENNVRQHHEQRQLAERVLAFDHAAILEVIKTLSPFATISELGSSVSFEVRGQGWIAAEIDVHSENVIPSESLTLLQSGRASTKKMPRGEYFRLYQDYVCSAVLRMARELFAVLPLEGAIVTAKDEILNPQTGHVDLQPILSVCIPRRTFEKLDLDRVDPSDSMRNFVCNMDFKPTVGLRPVLVVREPPELSGQLATIRNS